MPTSAHDTMIEQSSQFGPILVVDDDPQYRTLIRWALEDEGFTVATAADGREALARSSTPELVILDVALPLHSGDTVATALRRSYGDSLRILTITADGRAEEKARRMQAQAYLQKPFGIDELVDVVCRLLGVR